MAGADKASGVNYEYTVHVDSTIGRRSASATPTGVIKLQIDAKNAPGVLAAMSPMGCFGRIVQ